MSKLQSLTLASRKNSGFSENYIQWDGYIFSESDTYLDEALISIFGSPEYNTLSIQQKQELGRLELCQNLSIYSYGESIMCIFMAKFLTSFPIGSDYYNCILREQIEEYRHQDMFERAIRLLGSGHIPLGPQWKYIGNLCTFLPAKYFLLLQLSIEIISSDFGRKIIENNAIHPLVRDVCTLHEIEESRHLELAKIYLHEHFNSPNIFSRTFGGIIVVLNVLFINQYYFDEEHYKKIGVTDTKSAVQFAKKQWKGNRYKNLQSKKGMEFLQDFKLITPLNSWLFNWLFK